VVVAVCAAAAAAEWSIPEITLPTGAKHPVIACTPAELARLRAAWKSAGPEHGPVAGEIARADAALTRPLAFPPRGGQHNQWYQCEACQMGLKTVDATHHRCPRCGKVYTGQPYDDVLFGRLHDRNLRNMTAAAWAWAVTGRRKYADFARRILLGYAERYREYPYHDSRCRTGKRASRSGGRLFEQTLNEAAAMSRCVAPACDLVYDALSPEERAAVRDGLLVPMLENIAKHQAGKSNWQTWHNAGMLWGGAVLGEARWVRRAVSDPKNGFAYQMGVSVSDEGMWYENSWGYHFYTLSAMVRIVEGARRLGIDLWGHPRLRKMFTLPARYAMADGSLPRFGDAVGPTVAQAANYAEAAWHACKAPELAGLLPERPTWETVMFARKPTARRAAPITAGEVFPGAGHAILRTKGAAGLTAAITFGPYGGFHGHYDKLSFVFFGHGRELGVDPGRARSQAYRLPIHRNWYKATVSHNAVLVDGASQRPAAGKLERFAATESHAAVVASCDAAYPGVRHRRMLCMTPAYLLVLDCLAAEKPRQFAWVYHNRGTSVRCAAAEQGGAATEAAAWWQYIANRKTGATDGAIRVEFADRQVATHLSMAAGGRSEVLIGDGPGESVLERVPLVMIRRRGRAARFACVLEPLARGGTPAVTAVETEQTPTAARVTIRRRDTTDTVILTADNTFTVQSGAKVVLHGKPQ